MTRFGVVLLFELSSDPGAIRALAEAVEAADYDSIWLTEHTAIPTAIESRYPFTADGSVPFAPETEWGHATISLGFIAAITRRVRLCTCVIPMNTRDPLGLAKEAAAVDRLSGGRLELGIGPGWLQEEARVLGRPDDRAAARMEEALEIMTAAWSAPSFSHDGEFWRLPEVHVNPKPVQGGGLPVWIGGSSRPAIRATVAHGTGNVVLGGPDEVRSMRARLDDLREGMRVAVATDLADEDVAADAAALVGAGADVVMLRCRPDRGETVAETIERLDWFAREVRPELSRGRR